jgi:hypothetical protein
MTKLLLLRSTDPTWKCGNDRGSYRNLVIPTLFDIRQLPVGIRYQGFQQVQTGSYWAVSPWVAKNRKNTIFSKKLQIFPKTKFTFLPRDKIRTLDSLFLAIITSAVTFVVQFHTMTVFFFFEGNDEERSWS